MADCRLIIENQVAKAGVLRPADMPEIYLAHRNLSIAPDLKKFTKLLCLWLNGNKIRSLEGISHNVCLRELRLQNNRLVDLSGALSHINCLELLMLHNNQLQRLQQLVHQLRHMMHLKVLTLHNNPVAQEKDYRLYTIHHIPSVKLLDFREVQQVEHIKASMLINQDAENVKAMIGFGSRSAGHLIMHLAGDCISACALDFSKPRKPFASTRVTAREQKFNTLEEAYQDRTLRRSIMEFSRFDWSKVPRAEERRVLKEPFETPQLITTRFR